MSGTDSTYRILRATCLIAAIAAFIGCNTIRFNIADQKIVIDGFIEDGGHPVVTVTGSIPVSSEYIEYSSLDRYVLRWAKVTVTGPEGEVVLTGQKSDKYFPPYIYTTGRMTGKAGEEYHVRVQYGDAIAEASTTIPDPVELSGLRIERKDETSDSYMIKALIKDNPDVKNFYRFFVKVEKKDSSYLPSFMGVVDDSIIKTDGTEMDVCRGMKITANMFDQYYTAGDKVHIKFASMDKDSYNYWNDYENLFAFSRNPFFPSSIKIRSNVRGGLGIWAGYGSVEYSIAIPVNPDID